MNLSFFAITLFISSGIALALAAIIWTRRPAPGIVPLTLLMIAAAVWILASAFEVSAIELSTRIIYTKISYLGVTSAGVLWLVFALDYCGSNWWRRPRNLILVSILPLATLIIVWTNELHGLEWSNVYLTDGPLGLTSIWEPGSLYYMNPLTQYALYLAGIVIISRFALHRKGIYRKQTVIILTGTMIPIIGNIVYALRVNIAGGMDLTPLYLTVSVIFYSVAILRFQFLDIVPVAYRAIIGNIPDGVLILNTEGGIIDANQMAERLVGQEKPSLQGKLLSEIWPELHRTIAGLTEALHIELTIENSGTSVYLDIGVVTLYEGEKNIVGKLVVLRDITTLKTAKHELEVLYNREHQLNDALDKEINKRSHYTRALVHELGTPLTSIITSAELLEELAKEPVQVKLVKNIVRSSSNLEHRVSELLDLARGELGIIKIEPQLLDLHQLLQEVVAEMSPLAAKKGITLRTELSETALLAKVDKKRIRQVIFNLLSNSLKFTFTGEIIVRDKRVDADFLEVQVEDTGIGMTQEKLDNLFDPYYWHTKGDVRTSGLGIGLSLSKMFVELHKGEIRVESHPGKGTIFNFTIPSGKME